MVKDLIYRSKETDLEQLCMSDEISSAIYMLRDFLYEQVYESDKIKKEFKKAKKILRDLYNYYLDHVEEIFVAIPQQVKINKHRVVCDFIAGMTDRFALMTYESLFMPQQWTVL
jgi:dGTPase